MAIDRDTTFTWYGHSCWQVTTPGGRTIILDPWFSNPSSPKSADLVDRCDLLLVTHGHSDHFGDALMVGSRTRPTWPCMHEMSLWLARNFAHKDSVIGMNKGGTVEAAGIKVTMVHADHSAGDIYGGAEAPIYFGEPVGFIVELENGFRFLLLATRTCSATCGSSQSATDRSSPFCRSAATSRWIPPGPPSQRSCSA